MSVTNEFSPELTFADKLDLLQFAQTNNLLSIRDVLKERKLDVNEPLHHGQTLLVTAVLFNNVKLSQYLIRGGAKPCVPGTKPECNCQEPECPIADPLYPLQAALDVGNAELVLVMLKGGSKPLWHCDATLKDLLTFAVVKNHEGLLDWLLFYVGENYEEDKCMYACHALLESVTQRNKKLAALLLDKGVCPSRLYNGTLPLVTAAEHQDFQMCNYLIVKGANLGAMEEYSAFSDRPNPLVVAINAECEKAVAYLISKGCDVNGNGDWISYDSLSKRCLAPQSSMLHFAVFKRNLAITKHLVQAGCRMNQEDAEGNTPLHIACQDSSVSSSLLKFLLCLSKVKEERIGWRGGMI